MMEWHETAELESNFPDIEDNCADKNIPDSKPLLQHLLDTTTQCMHESICTSDHRNSDSKLVYALSKGSARIRSDSRIDEPILREYRKIEDPNALSDHPPHV